MQFDKFDKKVREAADHHHPPYDEDAWKKMEKLLDKHLPQKKDDKRRIILFLLLLMMLGGGIWFFASNYKLTLKSTSTSEQKSQRNNSPEITGVKSLTKINNTGTVRTETNNKENNQTIEKQKNNIELSSISLNNRKTNTLESMFNDQLKKIKALETSESNISVSGNDKHLTNSTTQKKSQETGLVTNKTNLQNNNNLVNENTSTENNNLSNNIFPINPDNKQVRVVKNENRPVNSDKENKPSVSTTVTASKKKAETGKRNNSLFFFASAGPDVSSVGVTSLGKLMPTYGVGIGYSFHDKFTLRAGFFSAREVYTTSPNEYHPPSTFWSYYPNLKSVNADCHVSEIPILLSYNFTNSKTHSFFGTVGLSSYLMNRETYNYYYETISGQYNNKIYSIKNVNKNIFSVLTLSGGYQRNINNTFSILAEPYIKIPFDGVGFGKMHLNSAGILLTVAIRPFKAGKRNKPK